MPFQIFVFVFSIVSFFFFPKEYSHFFCTLCAILFIISTIFIIIKIKKESGLLFFNLLFLFSFFLTSFAYSAYIYPFNPNGIGAFVYGIDERTLNAGTSLSLIGISIYFIGIYHILKTHKNITRINIRFNILSSKQSLAFYFIITLVLASFFIFYGERDGNLFILGLFKSIIVVTLTIVSIKNMYDIQMYPIRFFTKNILFFTILLFSIFTFLLLGDRGPALSVLFIIVGCFVINRKVLKIRYYVIIMIVGMFLMFVIQRVREEDKKMTFDDITTNYQAIYLNNSNDFWNFGEDLITCNRNVFLGLEYVERYGYQYGLGYFLSILGVIPGAATLVSQMMDNDLASSSSGYIITNYHQKIYAPQSISGQGSQIIIDIFMNFGIIGVCIIMYLFGLLVAKCSLVYHENIYAQGTLLFLICSALYFPRASLFVEFRTFLWILILLKINYMIYPVALNNNKNEIDSNK